MNKVIDVTMPDQSGKAGRVNGIVDRPTAGRIAGWAIDRADPASHVVVDIYFNGVLLGRVPATDHRKDLERNGIGTGNYGFKFDLSEDIDPDLSFAITAVARTADAAFAPLRNMGRMALSEDPALRLAQRAYLNTCALRQDIQQRLREPEHPRKEAPSETEREETLQRIELVQARLETLLSQADIQQPLPKGAGLKWAVALALLLGLCSFGFGVASLWMG